MVFNNDDLRAEIGRQALSAKDATIIGCFVDGKLKGVASYRSGEKTKLISISSLRPGCGRALVNFIRGQCGPIWCKGLDKSAGFYEAMGMKKGEPVMVGERQAYIYSDESA